MGSHWDRGVPDADVWREVYRVLKPGARLLSFFGTRTYHRGVVAIEDAGFEIRDQIGWLYGSGFPKSHDISKAIDKAAGAEREVVGIKSDPRYLSPRTNSPNHMDRQRGIEGGHGADNAAAQLTAPATEAARQWDGWGTALKPAWEPIVVARKPLKGTVAQNVLEHGTGGINVDGCRVGRDPDDVSGWSQTGSGESENRAMSGKNYAREPKPDSPGRFPANVIHDGSDEVLAEFAKYGETSKTGKRTSRSKAANVKGTAWFYDNHESTEYQDTGTAARFFYCAKASKRERGEANKHPTVKPLALMRYLVRLVTPPGGLVLDPFAGSGTTLIAARMEGMIPTGIEREPEYHATATGRLSQLDPLLEGTA